MNDTLTCTYGHQHRSEQQWRRCARRYGRVIRRAPRLARTIGRQHGRNAAEWWATATIGGRASGDTTSATARHVLRAIANGDPEVWDALPAADLSGQWADEYTVDQLARDCGLGDQPDPPTSDGDSCSHPWDDWTGVVDDCIATYEEAFRQAAERDVTRACRAVVDHDELGGRSGEVVDS